MSFAIERQALVALTAALAIALTAPVGATELHDFDSVGEQATAKRAPPIRNANDAERRFVTIPLAPGATTAFRSVFDSRATARRFLETDARRYAASVPGADVLASLDSQTTSAGVHIERFRPQHAGLDIFRETVNVLIDAGGNARAVSGVFSGTGAELAAPGGQRGFVHDAGDAVALALNAYGVDVDATRSRLAERALAGGYRGFTLPPDTVLRASNLRARAVYFRMPAGLVPAWYVETQVQRIGAREAENFAHVFAADDGRLLYRHNQVADEAFTYTAFVEDSGIFLPLPGPSRRNDLPHPTGTNDGYVPPVLPPQTVTLDHAPLDAVFPGAAPFDDPWLPAGATVATGNNAEAFADIVPPDGFDAGDVRPTVTSPGVFDLAFDLGIQPDANDTQRQAASLHQFYIVNWMHDWFYRAGFDEAAGNAQTDNYGRGGLEGDSLIAEGQDFSGMDNANMLTPADGARPRMRMYLASPPPTSSIGRDGTVDTGVVAHEWGHYINNRLIGDANGLNNQIGHGMSEGWGDFHALLLLVKAEDAAVPSNPDFGGTYATASFTAAGAFPLDNQNQSYFSIRRYPYSTDMSKNPLTLHDISNGVALPDGIPRNDLVAAPFNSEVHNVGEVWASMVWECYAGMLRDTLGATPRHSFDEARRKMSEYVVAGYKLTPSTPTLTEQRDALLSAIAASNADDFAVCAAGFAKRGAGLRAIAPDRYSQDLTGVTESDATGGDLAALSIGLSDDVGCDDDGILDPGETATLRIRVRNTGTVAVSDGRVQVTADSPAVTFPDGDSVALPTTAPYADSEVEVRVALDDSATPQQAIAFTASPSAPDLAFPTATPVSATLRVDANETASASDGFDARTFAWTPELTSGLNPGYSGWQPIPFGNGNSVAHAIDTGALGITWMVSPPLVVDSGTFGFTFHESHQFEDITNTLGLDGGVVEISNDAGATWQPLPATAISPGYNGTISDCCYSPLPGRQAFVGTSTGYPALVAQTVSLGTAYAGQTVLVRFGVATDFSIGAAGWNIDDVAFTGIVNRPFERVEDNGTCAPGDQIFGDGFDG